MLLLLVLVFGGVLLWLNFYTNHGQKLELENYIDQPYDKAAKHAKKNSFEIIVKDSLHKVGMPGGVILSQNPPGGAYVKEDRKIYVDVTKYTADEIPLSSISELYGGQYEAKKTELNQLEINTKVIDYRHDSGEPDHILEVRYNGKLIVGASGKKSNVKIAKGGTLEFVLSKLDGAEVEMPNLVCRRYSELNFLMSGYGLKLESVDIAKGGVITNRNSAWVIAQDPPYRESAKIRQGQGFKIMIQQEQPESCK